MARDADSPSGSRQSGLGATTIDRLLVGLCGAIWLVVLGVGVAATVALVDLGSGHAPASGHSRTPWLLYTVIGVSGLVIVAAIPLLVRARRTGVADRRPSARPGAAAPRVAAGPAGRHSPGLSTATRGPEAATEKLRVFGTIADRVDRKLPEYSPSDVGSGSPVDVAPGEAVDRAWLRCTVLISAAIGAALVGVGAATYSMAVEHDTPAWVAYGVAGAITLTMPVIPWFYLRQLRREPEVASFAAA